MCGRARCTLRVDDIPRACHLNNARPLRSINTHLYRPAYNVSPGFNVPVVRKDDGTNAQGVAIHCMKWGLIPSFAKKTDKPDHYKMFNARSETVTEKASFRRLLPASRCLVAVEGFYEWKKDGSKKQPYYIHFKDGRPMVFAGLYDSWKNAEGDLLYTFTILTTSSSSALAWLHDRMPVILGNRGTTEEWLDGSSSSKFDSVLRPYEEIDLAWYPVTSAMNKPSFDGPECIKEIQLTSEEMKSITSFYSKKGNNSEDSRPQVTGAGKASVHATPTLTLKEEPEKFRMEKSDEDLKPNVCQLTNKGARNIQLKDCEKLPAEEKPSLDKSLMDKNDEDPKSNVPRLSDTGSRNFQLKRDYMEFAAEEKPSLDGTDNPNSTPVSKKGNLGGSGHGQMSLFSYFGKG